MVAGSLWALSRFRSTRVRATSLRTYLGNLRAAGYVESNGGAHIATAAGCERIKGHEKMLVGEALYRWWLERLPEGEAKILRRVAVTGGMATRTLSEDPTVGLKATSVRTYVTSLMRRKLLVRPSKGTVALSAILLSGTVL